MFDSTGLDGGGEVVILVGDGDEGGKVGDGECVGSLFDVCVDCIFDATGEGGMLLSVGSGDQGCWMWDRGCTAGFYAVRVGCMFYSTGEDGRGGVFVPASAGHLGRKAVLDEECAWISRTARVCQMYDAPDAGGLGGVVVQVRSGDRGDGTGDGG